MEADQTYRIPKSGVASEQFDDEIILINLPRGNYYSLRHTAFALWGQLISGADANNLVDYVSKTYQLGKTDATQDVGAFLDQLLSEGLIIPADAAAVESVENDPVDSPGPYVKPELEVYSDMQDLLTLDPIHDVDSEQGWPIKK